MTCLMCAGQCCSPKDWKAVLEWGERWCHCRAPGKTEHIIAVAVETDSKLTLQHRAPPTSHTYSYHRHPPSVPIIIQNIVQASQRSFFGRPFLFVPSVSFVYHVHFQCSCHHHCPCRDVNYLLEMQTVWCSPCKLTQQQMQGWLACLGFTYCFWGAITDQTGSYVLLQLLRSKGASG